MPSSLKVPLLYGERQPELALEEQEDIHRERLLKEGGGSSIERRFQSSEVSDNFFLELFDDENGGRKTAKKNGRGGAIREGDDTGARAEGDQGER